MDPKQFDGLARLIGSGQSRRAVLKTLAGGALGALTAAVGLNNADAAERKRAAGNSCTANADCASNICAADPRVRGRKVCACGSLVDCPPAVDACHAVACVAGGCGFTVKTGAVCDDGDKCTTGDVCQADGSCKGAPVACTASDQCHVAGVCNAQTGLCSDPIKPNGASCNDGNLCTQTDACQNGVCTGGNPVVCAALDQCHDAGFCNPATGGCSNPISSNGTACNDGDKCTTGDVCQQGSCQGVPVVCPAANVCQISVACDPATGNCVAVNQTDGTPCGADNACSHDVCQSGECIVGAPKPPGTACNDQSSCTQTDACDGAGACIGGNPVTCPPPDACHGDGTCDTGSGQCGSYPILTGTCFIGGSCYAQGAANPANPCQRCDAAQSQTAWSNQSNGTVCNDNNACTQVDTCQSGVCTGGTPVVCTALDQCHDAGTCNSATGVCSNPAKENGTACNDGNACTQTDTCQAGTCVGGNPVSCVALDQCHDAGVCNTSTGVCSNPAKTNGVACNDGNACTQTDTCQAGTCVGSNPVVCTTANECLIAGTCNTQTGICGAATPKAEGATCSTGVCHAQSCCTPVSRETTCGSACGTVIVNNCGQSVTCDLCPCTVAGAACAPPEGSGATGVCQSDLRCCVTGSGFSGGDPGQWCSSVNCCSSACRVDNSHCYA